MVDHDPTFCTCPTVRCLENMLEAACFQVARTHPHLDQTEDMGRVLVHARKRELKAVDQLYEHRYPNNLLEPYDA
jgi:hypothetical protein